MEFSTKCIFQQNVESNGQKNYTSGYIGNQLNYVEIANDYFLVLYYAPMACTKIIKVVSFYPKKKKKQILHLD